MNASSTIKIASLVCLISVIFGAFGAHALRAMIDAASLENWKTATHYQFNHGVALFIVAILMLHVNNKLLKYAAIFFSLGILFFSGSLYFLSLRSLFSVNLMWLGPLTPIGGLCFMIGWLCLFIAGFNISKTN
jgi:uncharacterized membrane protein YgdD (TMEM256/DUF423 family)